MKNKYPVFRVTLYSGGYHSLQFCTDCLPSFAGDRIEIQDMNGNQTWLNGTWSMIEIGGLGDYAEKTVEQIESDIKDQAFRVRNFENQSPNRRAPQEEVNKFDVLTVRKAARIRREQNAQAAKGA